MVLVVHFQLLRNLVANHPYQPQTQQRIWAATDFCRVEKFIDMEAIKARRASFYQ
jgi:hypothetical protein